MKIEWVKKKLSEISLEELYSVLRLRSEVFVVEQDCVYQDIDNKDQIAIPVSYTHLTLPTIYSV